MTDPSRARERVDVFVYGDFACPHTYIAMARLDLLEAEGLLRVAWRPLQLRAGQEGSRGADEVESLSRAAAQVGLPFRLPERTPVTEPALEAAEFARDCGSASLGRFIRNAFRALYSEGRTLEDRSVLLEVAAESGLDAVGLERALEDGRYVEALEQAEAEADAYGIESTPTLLVGRFKLVGAAPTDVVRQTVQRLVEEGSNRG